MKKNAFFLLFVLLGFYYTSSAQESCGIIRMKDGQIKSHQVFVFVEGVDITEEMQPVLCLVAIDHKTRKIFNTNLNCKGQYFRPFEVSPGQTNTIEINGSKRDIKGTTMLFDLNDIYIPFYQAGMRAVPIITWINKKINPYPNTIKYEYANVIGNDEIYIGNSNGAILWTAFIIIIFFAFVVIYTRKCERKFWDLLKTNAEGELRLSLTLAQMFIWTIIVGIIVLFFGLMYLKVPDIPDTLIALMGLSIITGSTGYYQNKQKQNSIQIKKSIYRKPSLFDLISDSTGNYYYPSLIKTQHLLWTIIVLVLFVIKSISDGQLWSVPEELVVLMGISQGSHLIKNQIEINANKPQTPNNGSAQAQNPVNNSIDKPPEENASVNNQ